MSNESEVCFGCKKPIDTRNPAVDIEVAPGRKVMVHESLRSTYRQYGAAACRDSCLNKAMINSKYCLGCGEKYPGYLKLCNNCRTIINRTSEVEGEPELEWVGIDTTYLLPHNPFIDDEDFRQLDRKVARLFCQVAARTGRWRKSIFGKGVPSNLKSINVRKTGYGGLTSGDPAVEVTKIQIEAMQELFDVLAEAFEIQYREGVKKGHNALVRLAAGEISPNEFDAIKERDEEVRHE